MLCNHLSHSLVVLYKLGMLVQKLGRKCLDVVVGKFNSMTIR